MIMAIPTIELQKAIFNRLNVNNNVYEIKPTNQPFPYILIGEDITTDNLTKTNKRTKHNITIHTFTKSYDSTESKTLNNFVKESILDGLVVNGFSLDMSTLAMMMTLKEASTDGTIFHGVLQFEITLTQEVI